MLSAARDVQFWNRIARKYAASAIKDAAGYERTFERTRELLRSSDTVFEIGCGTGTTALRLASSVSHIAASDVSEEMIAIARERAAAQGCSNVAFRVADSVDPDSDGATFDAVLAFNLIHLVADRRTMLESIHRQLRPGGLFISKTPCLSEMNPLIRLAVPVARFIGKAPFVSFFTALELETEITKAGFSIIESARHGSGGKDPRIFIVARKG
jgi:ubiquinone/menaquinone biosynthesis C-methylase UbiE